MEPYSLVSEEASIVLVGSFNPAIFHPEWFVRHGLLSADDIEDSNIELIHFDLAKFSIEWLAVSVLRNKFISRTNDPSKFVPLRDLMLSTFKILEHTPINQMGMNLVLDYKISAEDDWHKIGDNLVPKNIWELALPPRVGMKSVTVQSQRNDDLKGFIQVVVSPAKKKESIVNFNINNHVELDKNIEEHDPTNILANYWEDAIIFNKKIADITLSEILKS